MNKLDVQQALARLCEGADHLVAYGHEYGRRTPADDAKLIRRFLAAERQEILVLRRYVLFGASELEGKGAEASVIAEMREAAKPKRKPR